MRITITSFVALLGLWLALPRSTSAQSALIDSLKRAAPQATEQQRAKIYADLCWEYRFIAVDSAFHYGQRSIALAQQLDDRQAIAQGFNDLAIIHILTGNLDTAQTLLEQALRIRLELKDTQRIAAIQNKLAIIAQKRGDLQTALRYNIQTLTLYEALEDLRSQAMLLNNIGIIHNNLQELEKAREYLRRSYQMKMRISDSSEAAGTLVNLGNSYETIEQLDSALHYFSAAKSMLIACEGSVEYLAGAYNSVGRVQQRLGNEAAALDNFEQALALRTSMRDRQALSKTYVNLAELYMDRQRYDRAKALLDSARIMIQATGSGLDMLGLFKDYHRYFAAIQSFDSAYHYSTATYALRDSLLGEESRKTVAELEAQYESAKKEQRIAELNQRRAEDALALAEQRSWTYGLLAALVILGILGWFIYDRKRQQAAATLAETEARLNKQMLETNLLVQEEERQRIAKEIHDGLVQSLAVLKLNIQQVLNESNLDGAGKDRFKQHILQLDAAAEEARNISHQMMPRALMDGGLIIALEEMLEKTLGAYGLQYSFEHFGLAHKRFKASVEVGLYRIAQEMVNNIIKHSGATNVAVQLYQTRQHLIMMVEDDGSGFDVNTIKEKSGIGLHNIFSRASAVHGEVNYEHNTPTGTLANIRIPIEEAKTD
jgi:signal transduction histidine kinase